MTDNNLALAVNHAISDYRSAVLREGLATSAGSLDSKRPTAWCEYGFPEHPQFNTFYRLWRRGGIAHGTVSLLIDKCWQTSPWVIEGDKFDDQAEPTTWERATAAKLTACDFWWAAKEADRRRLVGSYSGVLIQLADNRAWSLPAQRGARIAKLIPAWEGQLQVAEWDTSETSATYGEPKAWMYKEINVAGKGPGRQVTVHPDRVIIFGDYREGISFLEPGLNAFINLEKVEGGSAESFLKNAARQLSVNFDKDTKLESLAAMYGVKVKDLAEGFNDGVRAINRAQDAALITQGAQVTTLTANVPDPEPHYSINLQTAAASVQIATRIITGSQSGERASTEDQKGFNARGQGRRVSQLSRDIAAAIRHLQDIGQIDPTVDFTVIWDDLTEFSQGEKLDAAAKMADINQKMLASGTVFTAEEIRDTAGFENDAELPALPELPKVDA
jgi:hypothetical protein